MNWEFEACIYCKVSPVLAGDRVVRCAVTSRGGGVGKLSQPGAPLVQPPEWGPWGSPSGRGSGQLQQLL